MQMQAVDGDANALTAIEVLEISGRLARYQLRPLTGQKHQLRAHMAALGVPIVNDRIYPVLQPDAGVDQCWNSPLKLLAKAISFVDPITGSTRSFESQRTLSF
jgi:tRNA pseudouridine32 synthase/23S rRNA pseudouridine746 synthase